MAPNFGGALKLILALDATRPFPERKWSLPSNSRQGFLTSGSNASPRGLPDLVEISDHLAGGSAIAGTQWREPCGLLTRFPCHPLWAPVTVNADPFGYRVEIAIYLLKYQRTNALFSVAVARGRTLYLMRTDRQQRNEWLSRREVQLSDSASVEVQ